MASKPITVTQLNNYIKQIFDAEEMLHNIRVLGEISGISTVRGTAYFNLKDENALLSCVCFYPDVTKNLKEGESVILTGSPNFYSKGGKLNFNVIKFEPFGQGELFAKFLELKNKLESEGLFDKSIKKAIPKNIKRIGVVTSREGAVIQDIINVSKRRDPSVDIVLFPVKVQGNGAEIEIANGIRKMSVYDNIDVIIVARGGGSLEDLQSFNSEVVARAVFDCNKPLISAVGHETDFTIIDFASDLRAPTPSAAAEILTEEIGSKRESALSMITRFSFISKNFYQNLKIGLDNTCGRFLSTSENVIDSCKYELDKKLLIFEHKLDLYKKEEQKLTLFEAKLNKLNPIEILKLGYAKLEKNNKAININMVEIEDMFDCYLDGGKITAKATEVIKK